MNGWTKTRLVAWSVYMDVRDKLRMKSRAIMMVIRLVIVTNALPHVAMRDLNNPPEALASSGWLHTLNGYIVTPSEAPCKTTNAREASVLDYAVVSKWPTPMDEDAYVAKGYPFEPHK